MIVAAGGEASAGNNRLGTSMSSVLKGALQVSDLPGQTIPNASSINTLKTKQMGRYSSIHNWQIADSSPALGLPATHKGSLIHERTLLPGHPLPSEERGA